VTPDPLHDFFFASAGVAGALIGLLFVAISVEHDRITAPDADQVSRVRARAALTAFTNALTVSLWALVPGNGLAWASIAVGTIGVLFVLGSALSVRRLAHIHRSHTHRVRDLTFLVTQAVVFGLQIVTGIRLAVHPHAASIADDIAELLIVCFLIGVFRSWELIGGPDIGFAREVRELFREQPADEP
jgi:hypothetical protein